MSQFTTRSLNEGGKKPEDQDQTQHLGKNQHQNQNFKKNQNEHQDYNLKQDHCKFSKIKNYNDIRLNTQHKDQNLHQDISNLINCELFTSVFGIDERLAELEDPDSLSSGIRFKLGIRKF